MVFAVYEQGMRIHTPRKTLLGRRGIDALSQANATRRTADTDSNSSHLEQLAEQPFEQIQRSAVRRREQEAQEQHSGQAPSQEQNAPQAEEDPPRENKAKELGLRALKAYTATENSLKSGERPQVTATMVMSTSIISAEFDASLQQGWQLMQQHDVHHLVLLNRKGALMGMISDKDILKATSGVGALDLDGRQANDVMLGELISRKLLTVSPDAGLLDIAHAMLEQKVSALPVVTAQDELQGIITRTDLLQAMVSGKLEAWY